LNGVNTGLTSAAGTVAAAVVSAGLVSSLAGPLLQENKNTAIVMASKTGNRFIFMI
jgi:hypothetical protein